MTPVTNPVGSAPGLVGRLRDRMLVLLPGVPQELEGLLPPVVRWLESAGSLPAARPDPAVADGPDRRTDPGQDAAPASATGIRDLDWSWWLTDWGVDVRLAGGRPRVTPQTDDLAGQARWTTGAGPPGLQPHGWRPCPRSCSGRCWIAGQTLAVAESCTAGLIGGALDRPAGSSGFFRGGILAYADRGQDRTARGAGRGPA